MPDQPSSNDPLAAFGPNEWLVDELYQQYRQDKQSVDKAWWEFFEDYQPGDGGTGRATPAGASTAAAAPQGDERPAGQRAAQPAAAPAARASAPAAKPAQAKAAPAKPAAKTPEPSNSVAEGQQGGDTPTPITREAPAKKSPGPLHEGEVTPLRGASARVVTNMEASLQVPTATSVRAVPAKLLIDNRIVINNHLARARGGKVSFTHLIGYALVQALADARDERRLRRGRRQAVAGRSRRTSTSASPSTCRSRTAPACCSSRASRRAETLDFARVLAQPTRTSSASARANKLTADDFAGTTISLTNPGGIGTVHSVPRLMQGPGRIIGVGALEYPAEFQGASEKTLAQQRHQQDHDADLDLRPPRHPGRRQSGEFLKLVHQLLLGEHGFYDEIFASLRIPYEPIRWSPDICRSDHDDESTRPPGSRS